MKNYCILFIGITILHLNSCTSKIIFIGTLDDTYNNIPKIFEVTKPDGGFQIVQTDKESYMWLATNWNLPESFKEGNYYTEDKIKEITSGMEKPLSAPEVVYFDHRNYRVVHMTSSGSIFDYLYLFEEFGKVKNSNTLKFSVYNNGNNVFYIFSYKI